MTLIKDRAVIIGQGYVGLPVAMRAVHGGYDVVGFEIDPTKVSDLNSGRSHVEDISADQLGEMIGTGRYQGMHHRNRSLWRGITTNDIGNQCFAVLFSELFQTGSNSAHGYTSGE